MMTEKNNGNPAFPMEPVAGMSLRDYFAIHANENDIKYYMKELESITGGIDKYIYRNREQAKYAYADAMIKEREK